MQKLTPLKIKSARKPGYYQDAGTRGLNLQVTKTAKGTIAKSWVFRYTSPITGKARWMGLGSCDVIGLDDDKKDDKKVPLAGARTLANAARGLVTLGIDPIEHRKATLTAEREAAARERASRMTFSECARAYLAEHLETFRNEKHRKQWQMSLDRACEAFGEVSVAEIDTPMLVKFLHPIWTRTPETGSRIRGRVEQVLNWATARGFRQGENVARWRGHLEHLLKARPKAEHHAAMPVDQLPAFMARLRERNSISARALELLILTACRTGEVIGARRGEIVGNVWTIPASRMKSRHEHVVPLCDRALAILASLPDTGAFVFPGARDGKPLSNMALLEQLRGLDANGYRVHGFRSTFRDWAGDRTSFPREVIEASLAHGLADKTEAAYRRSTALDKRRRLMEAWAHYCAAPASASVTPIGQRA